MLSPSNDRKKKGSTIYFCPLYPKVKAFPQPPELPSHVFWQSWSRDWSHAWPSCKGPWESEDLVTIVKGEREKGMGISLPTTGSSGYKPLILAPEVSGIKSHCRPPVALPATAEVVRTRLEFESCLWHWLSVGPWESHCTSLRLHASTGQKIKSNS